MNDYRAIFEVEAIQFTDEDSIKAITKVYPYSNYDEYLKLLIVDTKHGILCMNKGDYIAKLFGSTVVIPANIFEESFKKV